jgi:hypothetical protein
MAVGRSGARTRWDARATLRRICAVFHNPGDGERLDAGATEIVIKATGEDTGGTFFLAESTIPPNFPGPPPHTHESSRAR